MILKKKKIARYRPSIASSALKAKVETTSESIAAFAEEHNTSRQNIGNWINGREPCTEVKEYWEDVLNIPVLAWYKYLD